MPTTTTTSTTTSPTPPFHPIFHLSPGIQSYQWGKLGSSSLAAQFGQVCLADDWELEEGKEYAELWMGTHPTLPSYSQPSHTLLSTLISSSPTQYLSSSIVSKYPTAIQGQLPFLFKVLSIGKALSIQAHPNKQLAEKLFKEQGDVYKDPNHKPEMAIALTSFRGFCGFLPLPTLLLLISTIPELRSLIGESPIQDLATSLGISVPANGDVEGIQALVKKSEVANKATSDFDTTPEQKKALKNVFQVLMMSSDSSVKETLRLLLSRYESNPSSCATSFESKLVDLVKELNEQYPDDVGVLCTFLLNVVELGVGEAMFLGADEPHAYISGDIIECMATSDNVVRAGLTPKLRDVSTLLSMLTYTSAPSHAQILKPTQFSPRTVLYDPPIEEFSVLRMELSSNVKEVHRPIQGPSIVIVTDGKGTLSFGKEKLDVKRGEVIFIAADTKVEWESEKEGLVIFRAYVEA